MRRIIRRLVFAYRAPKAFAAFQREHEAMAAEGRERWKHVRERGVKNFTAQIRRMENCPQDVMDALYALRPEIGSAGYAFWEHMVLYAMRGRGRHKLGMEWVEHTAHLIAEAEKRGLEIEEVPMLRRAR